MYTNKLCICGCVYEDCTNDKKDCPEFQFHKQQVISRMNKIKNLNLNNVLPNGLRVIRKSDKVEGYIEKFGHRFGNGKNTYNAYWVRWDDGHLGYPNENDFEPCK